MKSKVTVRNFYTATRSAEMKIMKKTNCWEKREFSYNAGGSINWHNYLRKQFGYLKLNKCILYDQVTSRYVSKRYTYIYLPKTCSQQHYLQQLKPGNFTNVYKQ